MRPRPTRVRQGGGAGPLFLIVSLFLIAGCEPPPPDPSRDDPGEDPSRTPAVIESDLTPAAMEPGRTPAAIETDRAPAAIGPYSQAVRSGHTVYLAGQIALDPETGNLVEGGIEAETRQVMENLGAVLEAAGLGFGDVVQSQVFLVDLEDFGAMNEIYGEYLSPPYPARATVQVAALPRGARVEIQFVAVDPGG
jgi:2-iminobutanoate/2-iminopropanoate deaminase